MDTASRSTAAPGVAGQQAAGSQTEYFRTDHLLANLGSRAAASGLVTLLAQGAKFALNLGSAVVLARLLVPEDFGLIGMVLALTGLLGLFKEVGLSTATVQTETVTQEQVSNLFWINVALSLLTAILCAVLAPSIAWFYGDPRLVGITLALSLTFPLTGSTVQHQALLMRQMRFRAKALIELISMLLGILVGCGMALRGFGYWSLVVMQLCTAASALALTWHLSRWRPCRPRRETGVAPLLRFGIHLTMSDLIGRLAAGMDNILIGRFFGAAALGFYTRANVLLARPLEQLLAPVGAVLIPVLSRLQGDDDRYRRTFMRAYDILALAIFPFSAVCLALSEPIVLLLLGEEWAGSVPLFAGFTLVAVSLPLSVAASWLFMSQGRGRDLLDAYVVLAIITVVAFVVGLRWGAVGVVMALATVSLFVRLPILYHLAGRRGPVKSADLWGGFLSHLPCWVGAYLGAFLAHRALEGAPPLVDLLVCAPVGMVGGALMLVMLRRPRESARQAWRTVRHSLVSA
jgi:PST family polysaccharide transporter